MEAKTFRQTFALACNRGIGAYVPFVWSGLAIVAACFRRFQ
jgi:hypothetical protein